MNSWFIFVMHISKREICKISLKTPGSEKLFSKNKDAELSPAILVLWCRCLAVKRVGMFLPVFQLPGCFFLFKTRTENLE